MRIPKLTVNTPTGRRRQRVPVTGWFTRHQHGVNPQHNKLRSGLITTNRSTNYAVLSRLLLFPPLYNPTLHRAPYWNNVSWMTIYVKNCMQHNPSWEADSSPASQKNNRILWKPKVHYRVLQIPPLVPHLSQISPRSNPICLRTTLILSSHLRIGIQSGLFPPVFHNKTLYACLHSCSPPCLSQNRPFPSPWFDHHNIWWCSSLYNFLQPSLISFFYRQIPSSASVLRYPQYTLLSQMSDRV